MDDTFKEYATAALAREAVRYKYLQRMSVLNNSYTYHTCTDRRVLRRRHRERVRAMRDGRMRYEGLRRKR